jgi:uncharacterized protein YfiM (DUF2279 family)
MNKAGALLCIAALGYCSHLTAQQDSATGRMERKKLIIGAASTTVIGHAFLYRLWYLDYPQQRFHWFNDNSGWLQMDKAGHAFSAFALAHKGAEAWKATGANQRQSALYGSLCAFAFQTPIEVFDGLSSGYGASAGDLVANTLGILLAGYQHYKYGDAPVLMRWSYAGSSFAEMRPNLLGSTLPERLLKDYNAQKYWLAWHPGNGFSANWPKWLGFSIGYGASGMLGANENRWKNANGNSFDFSHISRYRKWYFAPDIRLSRIPVRRKGLKTLFRMLDVYRLPLPAIELSQGRFHLRPLLF